MSNSPIALVTGANKGIGKETVRQLAALGYVVYLAARDADRGNAAVAALRSPDADIRFVELDVTQPESIKAAALYLLRDSGSLDILINNAGVALENAPPSLADAALLRKTFEVNVFGPVAVTQAFLPLLRAGNRKVIVNLSSELGSLALSVYPGFPFAAVNAFAYNASKTALNAFTVLLAKELLAEGFRVNSVNPGYTDTDLNGHTGPQSVAQAAKIVVQFAKASADGPSGGFFTESGTVPW